MMKNRPFEGQVAAITGAASGIGRASAEALLAGGARGSELASLVPAPVLQLAEARSRRAKPFRAIAPDRR